MCKRVFKIKKLNNGNYYDRLTDRELEIEYLFNEVKKTSNNGMVDLNEIISFDNNSDLEALIEDFNVLRVANALESLCWLEERGFFKKYGWIN